VSFTFNKAITGNSNNGALPSSATNDPINTLALTSAGNPNSLFANVDVNFLGYKSSNVAHTLSWNAARTVLTVTIPNASPAAIYSVDISHALGLPCCSSKKDGVTDTQICTVPPLDATADCGTDPCVIIYTFGASIPAAPVVQFINQPYDYNSTLTLSWLPVSQAKAYNVYCRDIQNWGAVQEFGAYTLLTPTPTTLASISLPFFTASDQVWSLLGIQDLTDTFVENFKIKITWQCKVNGVNADGVQGPDSNAPIASDTTAPVVVPTASGGNCLQTSLPPTLRVCFDEPMDKSTAETIGNYTFVNYSAHTSTGAVYTPPVVKAASYTPKSHSFPFNNPPNGCVVLTLDKAVDNSQLKVLTPPVPYLTVQGTEADVAGNGINVTNNKNACIAP